MTVDVGVFGTATEVSLFLMGTTGRRGVTLYIAGKPSGSSASRNDYWSLTPDEAAALGTRLIEAAGAAKVLTELEERTGQRG